MYISEIKNDTQKAKKIREKFERMKGDRTNWDSYWEEVAKFVLPRKDEVYGMVTPGEKKGQNLYDSTSIHANELLASALHSMLTNPSSVWFGLSTGEKELDGVKEVRQWLQDSTQKMIRVLNASNFQTEIHETYLDLPSVGTTILRIEEDDESVVRFFSSSIYEAYIEENNKGVVDSVYREYEYSLRQIVQEFGEDILSMELKQQYMTDSTKKYKVIHAVEPMANGSDQFASFHALKEQDILLREGKFNENPYAVPRWTKITGEKYGRSPSMKSLPDIRMLNSMMKTMIRAAQKAADPPLMIPDNGFLLPVRTQPGGSNIYRAGSKDRIEPLITGGRVDINDTMVEQARQRIKSAFFIDQLQLQQGPQMTATEVMQRTEENLRMMGPILGRLNNELLKPIIDRVFGVMFRRGLLGDIPEQLKGKDLEIKYVSQISKAQRSGEADTFTRVIQSVAPIIEMQPQMMENINGDAVLRYHAEIFGLPEEMLRGEEEVENARQAAADQQASQMQAQQENVEADTAQKLSNT